MLNCLRLGLCSLIFFNYLCSVTLVANRVEPLAPFPVADYTPFRSLIRTLLQDDAAFSSNCSYPPKSIMFTYSTHYTFAFLPMNQRAMDQYGQRHCIEKRFITMCLDVACHNQCAKHKIANCILIQFTKSLPANSTKEVVEFLPSEFAKNDYKKLCWLKHEMMYEALKEAENVFFFDADVVVFSNPFADLHQRRDEQGNRKPETFDIQFQRDRGRGPSCSGTFNTGQIYARNSSKVQDYFRYMFEMKTHIFYDLEYKLDQDYVENATSIANLNVCTLSIDRYIAHCFGGRNGGAPLSGVISFHSACVGGGVHGKASALRRFIEAVSHHRASDRIEQGL